MPAKKEPTTIDSYELGWKGRTVNGNLEWETAVFYLEQKDRRIFVSNPDLDGPPTLATTGQLYSSRGLEAAVRFSPTERTSGTVTYTYVDAEWDELIIAGSFGCTGRGLLGRYAYRCTREHASMPSLSMSLPTG